ncbi:hypothetical protein ACFPRL_27350 [Pseudoclavibacter helvolus]
MPRRPSQAPSTQPRAAGPRCCRANPGCFTPFGCALNGNCRCHDADESA